MFKNFIEEVLRYLDFIKFYRLYKEELIQIFILGVFLIFLYLILGFFLDYFIKITYSIKTKRKDLHLEKLKTIIKAFKSILKYTLFFLFLLFLLNKLEINLAVFLTGAGFLGATIVLIFQNVLRDIFTGWILFFEDLFREGEKVMINNSFTGRIVDFKSRFLILRGDKGEIISLPYSQISTVHNFSRKRIYDKLILKFKRDNLKENFLESLENLLKNNFANYKDLEFSVDKNFSLYENYFEITIVFKVPLSLKEEINYKIRKLFTEKFSDALLEIKNAS